MDPPALYSGAAHELRLEQGHVTSPLIVAMEIVTGSDHADSGSHMPHPSI